jgi:hypothetical protein
VEREASDLLSLLTHSLNIESPLDIVEAEIAIEE